MADIYSLGIVFSQVLFGLTSVEICQNDFGQNIFEAYEKDKLF